VELVVVIVILGILAAFAIPRYINLQGQARTASINGLAGNVRSAAALAKAQYLATGDTAAAKVTMDGQDVVVTAGTGAAAGLPVSTAAGIGAALQSTDGYTITYAAPTTTFNFATAVANCFATYDDATGVVTTTTSGCN